MSAPARSRGWYYGWNVIAITIVAQIAANGITLNSLSLFMRDWSHDLNSPISSLQLLILPLLLVSAAVSPLSGRLADTVPARWLMSGGLIGVAVFCLLLSTVTQRWQFFALYGTVLPIAIAFSTNVVSNAVVSRWFVRRIGLAMGLCGFGVGLSGVLLPPIIAWTLPSIGWRGIWRIASLVIAFLVTPLVLLSLRDRPTAEEGAYYLGGQVESRRPHGHGTVGSGDSALGWRDVLGRRNFWLLAAVYLPIIGIYGSTTQNFVPIATYHGLSAKAAGTLLSVVSIFHIGATLLLGMVSDRFGNRVPLALLAVVVACGALFAAYSTGATGLTIAAALVGAGGGMWTLVSAAVATEFGAAGFGRAFGLLMVLLPIDSFVPFAVARTHERMGTYAPALVTLAVICTVGGLLCLMLRERQAIKHVPGDACVAPGAS
jgi:MFS family permease